MTIHLFYPFFVSIYMRPKSDHFLALSLTHSLTTFVETWLVWLWLLNMPTQNWLTLVLLRMFVDNRFIMTAYSVATAWQQFCRTLLFGQKSELACPCLVWSVTLLNVESTHQRSGPSCLWQCFRFKLLQHFCQKSGHLVEKQTIAWPNMQNSSRSNYAHPRQVSRLPPVYLFIYEAQWFYSIDVQSVSLR